MLNLLLPPTVSKYLKNILLHFCLCNNITNTQNNVSTAANSGSTAHQLAVSNVECRKQSRGFQSLYDCKLRLYVLIFNLENIRWDMKNKLVMVGLLDYPRIKKEEYRKKRRMPRDHIKSAQSYDSHMLHTPCRGSGMEDADHNAWMNTNLNYQRGTMDVQHIYDMQGQERFPPTSYISGPTSEMKDASSEEKK